MAAKPADSVYRELGVRRVINAQGNRTLLGGCSLSPAVQRAMDEANQHYVEMEELLARSGRTSRRRWAWRRPTSRRAARRPWCWARRAS